MLDGKSIVFRLTAYSSLWQATRNWQVEASKQEFDGTECTEELVFHRVKHLT